MMGNKTISITVWLLLGLALFFPQKTEAGFREKIFPVPATTMQQAVTHWLDEAGFRLYATHTDSNRTDFRAEKETGRWHIVIRPQSALACHVNATWSGYDADPYEQLWAGIIKHTQSPNPSDDVPAPTIPAKVYAHERAIVCIHVTSGGTEKQISGFFIGAREGLVISTAHDLTAFQEITVELPDGRDISGQVVQLDPLVDLALIRVDSTSPTNILLSESRNLLNLGEQLYTIACPTDHGGRVTPGIINAPPRRAAGHLLWQVKMKILPGNSGSPVFDDLGRLVGVVKGRHRLEESVGFLIPMESVIAFIKANIDYVQ